MAIVALRERLKRNSLLVSIVRSTRMRSTRIFAFWNRCGRWVGTKVFGVRTNYEIVKQLAAFAPNSDSPRAIGDLTILSAQQTFPLICLLVKAASRTVTAPQPIESLFPTQASSNETAELAALFNQYGSDKSSAHDYHRVYASLLGPRRRDPLRLLEIGLGTNRPDVVSSMGRQGKPGASLRAFRDFCPNAQVFGADIDKRILFNEDRIRTYYVDQTKLNSFDELYSSVADGLFDLVIDDGLHSPNANIATMLFALKILRPSGYFIVEDIRSSSIPIWQVVAAVLPKSYSPKIVQAKAGLLFMIQRPD
jgi:SAM-dependent methyltransferase